MPSKTLKKLSDRVFVEVEVKDGSRPLEWRQSFKTVRMTLAKPSKTFYLQTNEVTWSLDDTPEMVGPSHQTIRGLVFDVGRSGCADSFSSCERQDREQDIWVLEPLPAKFKVTLTDRPAKEGYGSFAPGAFSGIARIPDDKGEGLELELSVPPEQFDLISQSFDSGQINCLKVSVAVEAFSFEVDDALREWYHPQSLFVTGFAPAALMSGHGRIDPDHAGEDQVEAKVSDPSHDVADSPAANRVELSADSRMPTLIAIKRAAWVAACALVVIALKLKGV